MQYFILFLIAVFLSACSPTYITQRIPLNLGGEIEVVKADPDWRSVVVAVVVRDSDGKIVGVVPGRGVSKAEMFGAVLTGAAIAGGSLGSAAIVKKGLESIQFDTSFTVP